MITHIFSKATGDWFESGVNLVGQSSEQKQFIQFSVDKIDVIQVVAVASI